jgi:hypothetical protein
MGRSKTNGTKGEGSRKHKDKDDPAHKQHPFRSTTMSGALNINSYKKAKAISVADHGGP